MMKRALALFMSFVMIFSMLPVSAFAETSDSTESTVSEEVTAPGTPTEGEETADIEEEVTETSEPLQDDGSGEEEAPAAEEEDEIIYVEETISETVEPLLSDGTGETTGEEETFGQTEFDATIEYVDGFYWLMQDMTITSDVTFDAGALKLLAHNSPTAKSITIADGATLTISGGILSVENGASITIEDGGKLLLDTGAYIGIFNNGKVTVKAGGTLELADSTMDIDASTLFVEDGATLTVDAIYAGSSAVFNNVDESIIHMMGIAVNSMAELQNAITTYANYASLNMYTASSFTLTGNVTIPENAALRINNGTTVTVASGVTVTNEGNITVASEGKVVNKGTISGSGTLSGTCVEVVASGSCGDSATWELTSDGVLTISGSGDMDGYSAGGDVDSPWLAYTDSVTNIVVEKGITSLGFAAFYGMTAVETVTLPEGIPEIPGFTFCRCTSLTSVNIPSTVTSIGQNAFAVCYRMPSLTFQGDVPTFDSAAFTIYTGTVYYPADNATWTSDVMQGYGGSITWIMEGETTGFTVGTCGDDLTWKIVDGTMTISGTGDMNDYSMETAPWAENTSVVKVVFKAGITSVSSSAFWGCDNLVEIVFEGDAPTFGSTTFENVTATVTYPPNNTTWTNSVFKPYGGYITWIMDGETTGITTNVFGQTEFDSVIGEPNDGYWMMQDITITGGVTFSSGTLIVTGANPTATTTLTIGDGGVLVISADPATNVASSMVVQNGGSIVIEDGGQLIVDPRCYLNIVGSSTVTVQSGGTLENYGTINGTPNVETGGTFTDYTIPRGDCGDDLTWVIENGTLTISGTGEMYGYSPFDGASYAPWYEYKDSITSIVVEEGVTTIGFGAFTFLENVTTVSYPATLEVLGAANSAGCTSIEEYIVADGNTHYYTYDGAIINAKTLELFVVPVTKTGTFTVPSEVVRVGGCAFEACSDITEIVLNEGLKEIGEAAFYGCTGLTSITIPSTVTSIERSAFECCSGLTEVILNEGLKVIGEAAFCACSALTSLSIPSTVESIVGGAFRFCSAMTEITLPEGITLLDNELFLECTSLESITIPASVTTIGDTVFCGCTSLTEITIPAGVTSIAGDAFSFCPSLTEITFEGDAPSITGDIFTDVTATAYYPADNTTWTADVKQNYGGDIIWVQNDQLSKVLVEGSDGFYTLSADVTITDESIFDRGTALLLMGNTPYVSKTITIAKGGKLTISGNSTLVPQYTGSIIVEAGGELVLEADNYLSIVSGGSVTVENGGTLTANGASVQLNGGSLTMEDGAVIEGVDTSLISVTDVTVTTEAELLDTVSTYSTYAGASVTLSGDITLTNSAAVPGCMNLTIAEGATLTISSGAALACSGSITVANGGTLINNGVLIGVENVTTEDGGTFTDNGSDFVQVDTVDGLTSALATGSNVEITGKITLETAVEVPEGVTLLNSNVLILEDAGTLTVNGTLVNNRDIEVWGGTMTIGDSGSVINNSSFWVDDGSVTVNGSLTGNTMCVDVLDMDSNITLKGVSGCTYVANVTDSASLVKAAGLTEKYGSIDVNIDNDLTIEDDVTISNAINFAINSGADHPITITVAEGATLTLDQDIMIQPYSNLVVNGELVNNVNLTLPGYDGENQDGVNSLTVNGTMTSNGMLWINMASDFIIAENAVVKAYGSLFIAQGDPNIDYQSTMTVNGTLEAYGYLAVNPKGVVNVGTTGVLSIMDSDNSMGFLDMSGTMTVDGWMENASNVGTTISGTMTVSESGTLNNNSYGEGVVVVEGGTLTVNGTVYNNSRMIVDGGTLDVSSGTYSSGGELGLVLSNPATTLYGAETANIFYHYHVNSFEDLKAAVDTARNLNGWLNVFVQQSVDVTEDLSIPGNMSINLNHSGDENANPTILTVKSGVTLSNTEYGNICVNPGTMLVVEAGATLYNNCGIDVYGGTVIVEGTYQSDWDTQINVDLNEGGTITGAGYRYIANANSLDELKAILENSAEITDNICINIFSSIIIDEEISIPANVELNPSGWEGNTVQLIVADGGKLTLNSHMYVNDCTEVVVENGGELVIAESGALTTNFTGHLLVKEGGTLTNYSFVEFNMGSCADIDGTMTSYGDVHIALAESGTLNISGTMNCYGYLNVMDKLNVYGTLNILREGDSCGFLQAAGEIFVGGTINQNGMLVIGNENGNADMYVAETGTLNVTETELIIENGVVNIDGKLNVKNSGVINRGMLDLNRSSVTIFDADSGLINYEYFHVGMGPEEEKYTSILTVDGIVENYGYFCVHPKGYVSITGEMNISSDDEHWGFLDIQGGQMEVSGTLNINNYICVGGSLTVTGTLNNNNGIDICGGTLDVSGGTYAGNGWIDIDVSSPNSTILGVETGNVVYYYNVSTVKELRAALREASNYGWLNVNVNADITVTADITIPGNVGLNLNGGEDPVTLSIANGATMTNAGYIGVNYNAVLEFREGTALVNDGGMYVSQGTVNMNGTYSSEYGSTIDISLVYGGTVNPMDTNTVRYAYDAWSQEELSDCLMAGQAYGAEGHNVAVYVYGDLSVSGDMTVYDGTSLYITNGSTFTVEEGVTFTNKGSIEVSGEATLLNNGTIANENEITILENCTLENNGTINGNSPVRYGEMGNQIVTNEDELRRALENDQDWAITIQGTVTLTENLETNAGENGRCMFIEEGGHIVVPDGMTLTLNCYTSINHGGKITVKTGGKLVNNDKLEVYGNGIQLMTLALDDEEETTTVGTLMIENGAKLNNAKSIAAVDGGQVILGSADDYTKTKEDAEVVAYVATGSAATGFNDADVTEAFIATDDEELAAYLEYAAAEENSTKSVVIELNGEIEITGKIEIPENVTVNLKHTEAQASMIIIGEGASVTLKGTLNNEAYIEVSGTLDATGGTYTQAEDAYLDTISTTTVTGIDKELISILYYAATEEKVREYLAVEGYRSVSVATSGEISLTENLSVPDGVMLAVGDGGDVTSKLTVPENITLTGGVIVVLNGSELIVNGTVENNGNLRVYGTLTNNGTVTNNKQMTVYGEYAGEGTVTGNKMSKYAEVYNMSDLLAALEMAKDETLSVNAYVFGPFELDQDITIPGNMTLFVYADVTVPEDISVTNQGVMGMAGGWMYVYGAFYNYETLWEGTDEYPGYVYVCTGAVCEDGTQTFPYTITESLSESDTWTATYSGEHSVYYLWTAEVPGTLTISTEGGSVGGLDLEVYAKDGDAVVVSLDAGETVSFCVSGDGAAAYTAAFKPTTGASWQYPFEIENLPATISAGGAHDLYYSYTAGESFTLTVESPAAGSIGFFCENGTPISSAYDPEQGVYRIHLDENQTVIIRAVGENEAAYTIRDSYVAQNSNGTIYESVADALAAAKSGETVTLLRDCEAEYVMLLKGVTLDLNGYTLTAADGAVAIKGNVIKDSSNGNGMLAVGKEALVLDEANGQMPVWVGSGYQFTTVSFNQMNEKVTEDGFTFRFKPKMADSDIQTYLCTNFADSGLSVVVRLSWSTGSGRVCQDFIYDAQMAQAVFVRGTLTLGVSGVGSFEDITATALVISDAEVEAAGKTLSGKVAGE